MFVQLRKWQQHMQEQLKASQLEELLLQQEEQQRQLVKMNGSKDSTKGKNMNNFVLSKTWRLPITVSFQCCVVVFLFFARSVESRRK